WVVTIGLVLFAFSTLLAWSYYGERNIERLFGRWLVMPFRVFFSLVVFIGATAELEPIWLFSDIFTGLMALPNLIGLLVLSGLSGRETKHYLKRESKVEAAAEELEALMAAQPGWEEWKSGDVVVSSHSYGVQVDAQDGPVRHPGR